MKNMIANIAQLALLSAFGYWLLKASLTGMVDYGFLAEWTGFTALVCGGLALFLELAIVTGRWAKILTTLEAFGYLLWVCCGYIGIPITDSPLKTGGILVVFLTWNGFQLACRVSRLRAEMRKKSLSFEELLARAEEYARKRKLDTTTTQRFLQEIQQIVRGGVPRDEVIEAWSRLSPGHTREFLLQVL